MAFNGAVSCSIVRHSIEAEEEGVPAMAGSVNKVILVGNLGADPDIRTMQSGGRVANLSVATSESWKDKNSGARWPCTSTAMPWWTCCLPRPTAAS